MATYVQGYQKYNRETKPFTPDYKFLSAALGARQDRYDTSYKQLSDQYSKVVYADISREDTKEIRDQYTNKLIPKIEQLSGMDLSLRQNVDAAKGLFKPFYEDDLIVKDMVFTSQFKKNMRTVEAFKNSESQEQRKKYWTTGVQALNYQMNDFLSADRETAIQSRLPQYVQNVDLNSMADEILKNAGFKDVVVDIPPKEGDPFIVRQKNGSAQVPGAYNYLMKSLMEDPRVIDAYKTSGFVKARSFAERGVSDGQFSSIAEGTNAWAQNTINELRERNATANPILRAQFDKALSSKQDWERYAEQEGVIEGSDEDIAMQKAFEDFNKAEGSLNRNKEALQRFDALDENSDALNFAYNMLMNYNLSSDILGAATAYSNKDTSTTLEVNPYTKMKIQHKYDIAKISHKSTKDKELAILKGQIDGTVDKEGNIINLVDDIFGNKTGTDAGSTQSESPETVEDPNARNLDDRNKRIAQVALEQANYIIGVNDLKNSALPISEQKNKITIQLDNGESFTGSPEKVIAELTKKENVNALAKAYKESFKEFTEMPQKNPTLVRKPVYNQLAMQHSKASGMLDQVIAWDKVSKEQIQKNWETAQSIESIPLGKTLNAGVPSIVQDGEILDEDAFIQEFIDRASTNKIDGGNYREEYKEYDREGGLHEINGVYQYAYVPSFRVNVAKAKEAAKRYYDDQYKVLNNTMNGTYNLKYDSKNAGLFKPLSADAYFRGIDVEDMNPSNLYSYGGYKESISVASITTDFESKQMLKTFNDQYTNTPGDQVKVYAGDRVVDIESVSSDPNAKYVIDQTLMDFKSALFNPESAESKKLLADVEYRPITGQNEDGTTYSGYTVYLQDENLKAFTKKDGPINDDNVESYTKINVVFPSSYDVNPKRAGLYNFSSTDTKIQISDDDSYLYDMFKEHGGSFRISKRNNVYYRSMDFQTVDPKTGEFVMLGQDAISPILNEQNEPVTINQLDRYVANYQATMADRASKNLEEQSRVKKRLGIK